MENLIFKPSCKKLLEAKKRRIERLEKLNNTQFTIEQIRDRENVETEVFELISIFRNRANDNIITHSIR